jgi:nucleoside-diphosphate-sugar epimerase
VRVFVTGATGLLGRHVTAALVARGDTVVGLSRTDTSDAALRALGAEPLRGDLRDDAILARGVARADAAVHAAAIVLSSDDWSGFLAANVTPTIALARACAASARRLVHISSVAAYGRATTYDGGAGSVSEAFGLDRPIFPGDHYARSKREAELELWKVADRHGLSAVALRPCVIYGEADRTFALRAARLLRRGIAPLIGAGRNTLSVVYAGNVAAAVLAALDRSHVTGAFNVANDGPITQREFIEQFAAGLGVRVAVLPVPRALARHGANAVDAVLRRLRPRRSMTLLRTAVQFLSSDNPYDSTKAVRELGWRPAVAPAEAVRRTGRWFCEHPAA